MGVLPKGDIADNILANKVEKALSSPATTTTTTGPATTTSTGASPSPAVTVQAAATVTDPDTGEKTTTTVEGHTPDDDNTIYPRRGDDSSGESSTTITTEIVNPKDQEAVEKLSEIAIDRAKWKNRRVMAAISLWFFIFYSSFLLFLAVWSDATAERLAKNKDLLSWPIILIVAVPLAYMGATVVSENKSGQQSNIEMKGNFSNRPRRKDDDDGEDGDDGDDSKSPHKTPKGGPPRRG